MVKKDPATDPGKASKKGRVTLFSEIGAAYCKKLYYTDTEDCNMVDELETYFVNGNVVFTQTFEEVRANSML